MTTFAGRNTPGLVDGPASVALFNNPVGITMDNYGQIYVSDTMSNVVRLISSAGTTLLSIVFHECGSNGCVVTVTQATCKHWSVQGFQVLLFCTWIRQLEYCMLRIPCSIR